jgi:hypothetical protein
VADGTCCDSCGEGFVQRQRRRMVCVYCLPGVPLLNKPGPTDPLHLDCRGRSRCHRTDLRFEEVRRLCETCSDRLGRAAAAPTDLRTVRERTVPPREIVRRVAKNLCMDLCGRPRGTRSPRCKECLRIHRKESARRRQIARRRRVRDACPDNGGDRHALASTRAGAPARSGERRTETNGVTASSTRRRGSTQSPNPRPDLRAIPLHSTYVRRFKGRTG